MQKDRYIDIIYIYTIYIVRERKREGRRRCAGEEGGGGSQIWSRRVHIYSSLEVIEDDHGQVFGYLLHSALCIKVII